VIIGFIITSLMTGEFLEFMITPDTETIIIQTETELLTAELINHLLNEKPAIE